MSSAENQPELPDGQEISDGEHWLALLGLEHLKEEDTGYTADGQTVLVKNFDILCEDYARPFFIALEAKDRNSEDFKKNRDIGRKAFERFFGSSAVDSAEVES